VATRRSWREVGAGKTPVPVRRLLDYRVVVAGDLAEEPRGAAHPTGPIAPDLITLRSTAALAPTTLFGTVCLRRDVGGFEDARHRSTRLRAFGLDLTVLDLSALAQARTASSRREDIAKLPMLETLLALPALEERYRELAANRS